MSSIISEKRPSSLESHPRSIEDESMTFAEKLTRLTEGRNKQQVGLGVGLPATAISDYIAKGNTPRADKALLVARALNVPLDWLVDDSQPWPPPKKSTGSLLSAADDAGLREELTRRYRQEAARVVRALSRLESTDWRAIAMALKGTERGSVLPSKVADPLMTLSEAELSAMRLHLFELDHLLSHHRDGFPLQEVPPIDLRPTAIVDRMRRLFSLPGLDEVLELSGETRLSERIERIGGLLVYQGPDRPRSSAKRPKRH